MTPTTITCDVVRAIDADTLVCRDRTRIRLAGISALERSGACNSKPECPTMPYHLATPIAAKLTEGRVFQFRIYGRSGTGKRERFVGDNSWLRCKLIQSGAVVKWSYWWDTRYKLGGCA